MRIFIAACVASWVLASSDPGAAALAAALCASRKSIKRSRISSNTPRRSHAGPILNERMSEGYREATSALTTCSSIIMRRPLMVAARRRGDAESGGDVLRAGPRQVASHKSMAAPAIRGVDQPAPGAVVAPARAGFGAEG